MNTELPDGVAGEGITDRLTDEALKFIEQTKTDRFLYLSHYAVHTPLQAKDSLINKYRNKEPDTISGHQNAKYAAMIESVDQSMGALIEALNDSKD